MIKPRCQECGGETRITLDGSGAIVDGRCLLCGCFIDRFSLNAIRAQKRFELVKMLMCRPVGQWANVGGSEVNHTSFNYPMPDEAKVDADAILTELYGEAPDA